MAAAKKINLKHAAIAAVASLFENCLANGHTGVKAEAACCLS